uniref:Proteasome subunit beta n=1 Tax=Glossina brevipalpis TaxID=37001 RepID=A0A1A9W8Z1_9MUSC
MNYLDNKQFPGDKAPGVKQEDSQPYECDRSLIVAIAGNDFAVVAADPRSSKGCDMHPRNENKLFQLSANAVLASAGCSCDMLALTSSVKTRMLMYEHAYSKIIPIDVLAQMLSMAIYNWRPFPYFVSNILAGLNSEGKGVVYSYDSIGNFTKRNGVASGFAGTLLQPVLDNQIDLKNVKSDHLDSPSDLTIEPAVAIVSDAFISAIERDIYTGDSIQIKIVTKNGIEVKELQLLQD